MTPQLLDSKDVANILAITPRQATLMMNAGTLPTVRVSKSELRVPADGLLWWVKRNTNYPTDLPPDDQGDDA